MKIVVVGNNKGGVGKTFISKTLGEYSALQGIRTVLIDLDPQCNLSRRFLDMGISDDGHFDFEPPIHPEYHNDDDWSGYSDASDIWLGNPVVPYDTEIDHLQIIPAHAKKLADIELVHKHETIDLMAHLRAFLRSEAFSDTDLCIIDTRPSKSPLVQSAFNSADKVIIPTEFAAPAVEGLHGMLALQRQINANRTGDTQLEIAGIVGNRVKSGVSLHKEFREMISNQMLLSQHLLPEFFNDWIDYQKSMVFGAGSIFEYGSSSVKKQASNTCNALLNQINL
jgi:chromosome partitioning protein